MRFCPAVTVGILLGLASVLPGCGEERTAAAAGETVTASGARATTSGATAKVPTEARRCRSSLSGFLDSLESLDNTLAVGLDYKGYLGAVNHARVTYAAAPVDRLPIGCLARVASPAEEALNVYIAAVNTWGGCLATTACNAEEVEPKLQHEWTRASDLLSSAQSGLRDLG